MSVAIIVTFTVLGSLLIIALLILAKSCFVVRQAEAIVIERLGRFHRVLNSGLSLVVPFIDSPRQFTWRKTGISPDGIIVDETTTSFRIDLRENVFNFLQQEVYTKDGVLVAVNALMFYRIFDIKKAIYEVDDLQGALSNTAQTQLKEVFGSMTLNEALVSQSNINQHLVAEFSKLFFAWGIHVERMELLDLTPARATSEAMKKQMLAERARRADFIRSEGRKAAMRLTAEGTKVVSINIGFAEQDALRKRSEGEANAAVELARADATALQAVAQALKPDGAAQTAYLLAQRYMDWLRGAALAPSDEQQQYLYLPYAATLLTGLVARLKASYGSPPRPLLPAAADKRQKAVSAGATSTTAPQSSLPKLSADQFSQFN